MTDRYMVIHPDTLEAMHRAGHVAKLEARIEKLEEALREIAASAWDCNGKTCEHCQPNSCQNSFIARKALEGKDETIG